MDRAAGLLLMLFAQPASRIVQLTTHHVADDGHTVTLQLGSEPVALPEPLDELVRALVRRRRGKAVTVPVHESTWLFPGSYAGLPLTPHALAVRLKAVGIRCRIVRRSALIELASELPAFVVSRLLGFHQSTADNWQREGQGFGQEYAADLTRR